MRTIYLVAGARPNFMKIAPIVRAIQAHGGLAYKIIHTGQHYDREMNDVFFEELGIPEPDVFMAAGGGSHAQQTGKIMVAFEEYCQANRPDAVLVVGDVNSTLACSIVAKKLCIPVAHVEAGLRSGDMSMPEEINRLVTDSISDWFFVTEPSGTAHLRREGKPDSAIHDVGHVMVDNVLYQAEKLAHADTAGFETDAIKKAVLAKVLEQVRPARLSRIWPQRSLRIQRPRPRAATSASSRVGRSRRRWMRLCSASSLGRSVRSSKSRARW